MELIILKQDYSEWQFTNKDSNTQLNPFVERLFHGDVVDDKCKVLTPSPIRTDKNIPCILDFKGSTYGRAKDKLLYRCIPDDKTIPQFIVPYEQKQVGFDKHKTNKYVLIQFKEWAKGEKHPTGILVNTLGDTDNYDAYTEYQLYCKKLVTSLKEFNKHLSFLKEKHTQTTLVDEVCEKYPGIENRTHLNVFSIDPAGCTDIDDAIGIVTSKTHTTISVYIANVPLILDHFNLWQHITDKCSTVYLPDRKISMLPNILSDNVCSLLEDELRFAFVMDTIVKDGFVTNVTFRTVLIKLSKNYEYEEPDLLQNTDYKELLKLTQTLDSSVKDSHDLVEYFMVYMNHQSALKLEEYKCGIFRSAHIKSAHMKEREKEEESNTLPPDVNKFITHFKYASGQYCTFENKSSHDLIGWGLTACETGGGNPRVAYTHITSPIRRIVDIVNMTLLQDKLGLIQYKNPFCGEFCTKWQNKVDFINTTTKSIKKVQNGCNLLMLYVNEKVKSVIHQGYLFDRRESKQCKNKQKYVYSVYVPDYKMVSTYKTDELIEDYSRRHFTLHLFMDEANLKEKVRLQMEC
jgi:hypothetical protein